MQESFSTNFSPISKKTASANPFQSAYRAGHSTETVLLRIVNDFFPLLWAMTTFMFFFCWLFLPLLTLLTTKFSSPAWTLFWAFSLLHSSGFAYTSQTSVNNSSSSASQLMYGVPQGSVLGPILFALYTTPLSDIIANHSVNHQFFADDTQLQKSARLSEVTNLTKELNACTDDIKTKISSNWTTTKEKLFSFPYHLPWNLLPFPSLTRLLLALTTSPSLILPGTLD